MVFKLIQKIFSSNSVSDCTNESNKKQKTELEEKERLRKVKEETREYLRLQGYRGKITIVTGENSKKESTKNNHSKNPQENSNLIKNNYRSRNVNTFDPIHSLTTYESNSNDDCKHDDSVNCHIGND
ncbi:hypothetical protein [Bacillus toyonensis]|uniref:hypothetical protein n=1 Tax=Bacillus toyonensis TaxID=155322 RepID=UPI002E21801C|nr:hypothetical protein [Bacillus toyonensis]